MLTTAANVLQIALIDNGPSALDRLQQALEQNGHLCYRYATSLELMSALRRETFDLLVMNFTGQQASEAEVTEWISSSLTDPVAPFMLEEGASRNPGQTPEPLVIDSLVPPCSHRARTRVDALLCRRSTEALPAQSGYSFGPYEFDRHADALTLRGSHVTLTSKEYALSLLLFRNCGRALSRDYMMDVVWRSNAKLSTRTLDMHISRIRAKLKLVENGYHLRTLFGRGYQLERRQIIP